MESDFLNRRNNYKIDDEDAQLALHGYGMYCMVTVHTAWLWHALHGYGMHFICLLINIQLLFHHADSTSSRPCRYFNTRQGCARGNSCTFSHLKEGHSSELLIVYERL